jgi:hypothetical protein
VAEVQQKGCRAIERERERVYQCPAKMNILPKKTKRNMSALDRPHKAYWTFLENISNDFN